MLVLGRKPGEYIMIGDNIRVEVVRSKEGDLRLAIDAPREMRIVRGEIYEKDALSPKPAKEYSNLNF